MVNLAGLWDREIGYYKVLGLFRWGLEFVVVGFFLSEIGNLFVEKIF